MGHYNHNFFQIKHTGVSCNGALGDQQSRCPDSKTSNFGDLSYNLRRSDDYTRFTMGFKSAGELQNPAIPSFLPTGNGGNWYGAVNNPYVTGSTVKRVRNEEFKIITLRSRNDIDPTQPTFDVMDTNVVLDTTVSGVGGMKLSYPTEGYVTFGGRVAGPFGYEA